MDLTIEHLLRARAILDANEVPEPTAVWLQCGCVIKIGRGERPTKPCCLASLRLFAKP